MRTITLILLCTQLSGCFFFFLIPDLRAADPAGHCVGAQIRPGDRVRMEDGRIGIVNALAGPSERCDLERPIRAEVYAMAVQPH